ncbi:dihydrolipoyl dehydrogenase [Lampropedia puyangensis]|uniref:Dihydrolipoyl dehydrogenase n=1 Tax=Lampropedia puyangensis TaxID=1330072 RepID=A0A4S8FF68_9BURK|nr:dihydrolipoyl dehydrogenase [Lampropedia puyangensis]THU04522.1 dihydrolipoyl dehydrogenase [Lampropedia puyangensis]
MKTLDTDIAIIGVGSAGMVAYKAARKTTDRIVTIESGPYGTTCARVGCMPSKLLIAAANAARATRNSGSLGIHTDNITIDGAQVMQRVREERDRFAQFSIDDVLAWPQEARLHGQARFTAPGTLCINEHTQVNARTVIIATGSSPVIPDELKRALGDRLIVNDDIFAWTTLPQSVAVMGSGVIGLELAHALHALGVRVRLFSRNSKIGPLTDPEVLSQAQALTQTLLPTAFNSQLHHARLTTEGVELQYSTLGESENHTDTFDYLLWATGRSPNLAALNLAAAGVDIDQRGMPQVDPLTRQIPGHPIFMAGDVHGQRPLLHEATDDGYAAGHNAASWPKVQAYPLRASLGIVFSHPQITMVGQSHRALTDAGTAFARSIQPFANQGRARVDGQNTGTLALYAEHKTGRFLGAEMLGPAAEHLGHLLAWALQQKQTVEDMLACPFYHPTVEEGLRSGLQKLRAELRS